MARYLDDLPPGSTVLLRHPLVGEPGVFEKLVSVMAGQALVEVEWFMPEPGGRERVYERDYDMVAAADRIEAFFDPDHVMEGGTAHVVEAGITKMVPTYAWIMEDHGSLVRVGEWEPDTIHAEF